MSGVWRRHEFPFFYEDVEIALIALSTVARRYTFDEAMEELIRFMDHEPQKLRWSGGQWLPPHKLKALKTRTWAREVARF